MSDMKEHVEIEKNSYFQHEQWFDMGNDVVSDTGAKCKTIINSYGRVRRVCDDGTYRDLADGKDVT